MGYLRKIKINKKNIITSVIVLVIFVMSLGYAALNQYMELDGIASIDRSWIVKITSVTNTATNNATSTTVPSYVGSTVTLNSTLPSATSTITYTITLSNQGNIPAKLNNIEVIEDSNTNITYEITGAIEGVTTLDPGKTNTIQITKRYKDGVSNLSNTNKNIMVTFNYVENSGTTGGDSGNSGSVSEYIAYKPGDAVMLDPGDGTERLFYVITTDDTINDSTIQLISNESVTSVTAGNVTSALTNLASTWTRATSKRLPTLEEIGNLSGFTYDSSKNYNGVSTASSEILGGAGIKTVTSTTKDGGYYAFTTNATGGTIELATGSTVVYIRPVITVSKSYLSTYDIYKPGDEVTLIDGTNWYVTKESGTSNASVTLISKYTASSEGNVSISYTNTRAFDSDNTNTYDQFDSNNIGYFMKNTVAPYISNSINSAGGNATGLTARLLTKEEYDRITKDGIPDWIPTVNLYDFWLMTKGSGTNYVYNFSSSTLTTASANSAKRVRPVITILKENIQEVMMGYVLPTSYYSKSSSTISIYSATKYEEISGVMVYFDGTPTAYNVTATYNNETIGQGKISSGADSVYIKFNGEPQSYYSITLNLGSSSNVTNVSRVEVLKDESTTSIWTSEDVTVYFGRPSVTDSKTYSFNNGVTYQKENYVKYSSGVTNTIKIKNKDGNVNSKSFNYTINKIDKVKPTATFSFDSGTLGSNSWYTSDVDIEVTPSAGSSGVSYFYTCTTTSSTCTPNSYSTAASVIKTLSSESSTNKVCARVYSKSGVTGDVVCSSSYKIDTVKPSVTFAVSSGTSGLNEWYTSSIGVRVSPFTGVSGLNYYYTCTTTSSTCTPNTYSTATSTTRTLSSQSSSNKVCARVYSASGASSDVICSSSYKIDTVKPTCSLKVTSGTVGVSSWYRSNVTIGFNTYSDSTSGVYQRGISDYSTLTRTQTTDTSGTSYTGYIRDYAGNTNTCSITVKRDTVAPYVTTSTSYLNNVTLEQTNSSGTVVNATISDKSCSGNTCKAKVCLANVTGNFTISNVMPTFRDARSGYYTYSLSKEMLDKNGDPTPSGGCLKTQQQNPCTWKWTYSYRDYAGNYNYFYFNFTIDYQGYNSC